MCKRQLSAQEALLGFNEAPEFGTPKVQESPGFTLGLQFGHFSVQRGGGCRCVPEGQPDRSQARSENP
jgi:hypothetical protein